jgi:hypothetical protein
MSASGRVLELTRSLHDFVARMEPTGRANARPMTGSAKSEAGSNPMERSRIALRSIRATGLCPEQGRRDHVLKKLSAASFDARFFVTAC